MSKRLVGQITVPKEILTEASEYSHDYDPLAERIKSRQIKERESEYLRKRHQRGIDVSSDPNQQSYDEVEEAHYLKQEEERVEKLIAENEQFGNGDDGNGDKTPPPPGSVEVKTPPPELEATSKPKKRKSRWDVEPSDSTQVSENQKAEQPAKKARSSRWDMVNGMNTEKQTESRVAQPTPTEQNEKISDEMLDAILPSSGYTIVEAPENYVPIRINAHKLRQQHQASGFTMLEESNLGMQEAALKSELTLSSDIAGPEDLNFFKESDKKHFAKLLEESDQPLSAEEIKERKLMKQLLRIKNGVPSVRRVALRQVTDQARYYGAKTLFNQLLPLLMETTLEDQERHLLVKVIDRVLYKLGDLVRPYTRKIVVVMQSMLIDEDKYTRAEGQELMANLSKAAGLNEMILTLRPDIGHSDDYVRNVTARTLAVVGRTLGVPALLPFIKAVCKSKKSWEARHTGSRVVVHLAGLMGCGILPHLEGLIGCIGSNLSDDEPKIRTMTAYALAALADASAPYGIEFFEPVLEQLWAGVKRQRGRGLAAFLKCVGCLIPLMNPEYSNFYTREAMTIVIREFSSPDEDMRRTVLTVISKCSATEGVTPKYVREEIWPSFARHFWTRKVAIDRRINLSVMDTTIALSKCVGPVEILKQLSVFLRDESEQFRRMTVETIDKMIKANDSKLTSLDVRGEALLIDGLLTAFQEQTKEDNILLNGFGTVISALGSRIKPYAQQIISAVLFHLANRNPLVRQNAADLIARVSGVIHQCEDDNSLLMKLNQVLYEQLGEEYPEVLGSVLGAITSIVKVANLSELQPPVRDLLPRITPILRNRHEKVQEHAIELVGQIADRGAEFVSAREWMRICFELLDLLKAHKKAIRMAANETFGYIARAIGPQDVLVTLLNNLRVQERQSRVCTAVAIAIVAETCSPFTVLPALMNEYRVPDKNVQNGVLKSLTFLFEYIPGHMAKDYVYASTSLLEDALTDRDAVHRQTAASVVKHLALTTSGLGCEDAMVHFLNLLMPNMFETSPHVIMRILSAIGAIRNATGPGLVMNYLWAGLFHAARKVRTSYWRAYNDAYIQQADALVPYYPELEGDERRYELDVFI